MRRVVRVKLLPTPAQELALADTLRVCNEAATYVSQVAFGGRDSHGRTGNKIILQDVLYQDVKDRFGLGAQPAIRVIGKTADAYATLRSNIAEGNLGLPSSRQRVKAESKPVVFGPNAAQPFDRNCLSWQHDAGTVSIWSTHGRLKNVRFVGDPDQLKLLATHPIGESDLQFQNGHWFLIATLTLPTTPVVEPAVGFLGWIWGSSTLPMSPPPVAWRSRTGPAERSRCAGRRTSRCGPNCKPKARSPPNDC